MLSLRHRNHAPMRDFAVHVLKLDGCVVDVELVAQAFFHVAQNTFADRWRNVSDGDVAGESACLRPDVPHVQIVNIVHAVDLAHGGFDLLELDPAWRAFEQYVESLPHDAESRPQ